MFGKAENDKNDELNPMSPLR